MHDSSVTTIYTYFLNSIVYLYSAQYFHVLQDSKHYLTNPTAQVQPQLTSNWHTLTGR